MWGAVHGGVFKLALILSELIALVSNALPACGQEMQVPFCLPFDHLSTACARARTHTHTHTHMHAHAHIYTYTNLCLLVQACTAEASTACKSHAHTFCEGSMPMAWCEWWWHAALPEETLGTLRQVRRSRCWPNIGRHKALAQNSSSVSLGQSFRYFRPSSAAVVGRLWFISGKKRFRSLF